MQGQHCHWQATSLSTLTPLPLLAHQGFSHPIYLEFQARGLTHLHIFNFEHGATTVRSAPSRRSHGTSVDKYVRGCTYQKKHSLRVKPVSPHRSLPWEQVTVEEVMLFCQRIRFRCTLHLLTLPPGVAPTSGTFIPARTCTLHGI